MGDRQGHNEINDAALVCGSLGLAHEVLSPSDDEIARFIPEFARQQDQPIGDLAAFPYFYGMAQLPEDCTIILDGSGNDDYFGVTGAALALKYKVRSDVKKYVPDALWPAFIGLLSVGPTGMRRLSKYWSRPIEDSFVAWDGWNTPELTRLFRHDISFDDTYLWRVMREADPEQWKTLMTEVVGRIWEPQAGFAKGIHAAHALGKGLCFPFNDERLASWVHQLPQELKLDKAVLLAYMAKNLPREIVQKPKSGFHFNLNRLFQNPKYRWAEELDRAGLLQVLPSWSRQPIQELLDSYTREPQDSRWQHRLYGLCLLATVVAMKHEHTMMATKAGQ